MNRLDQAKRWLASRAPRERLFLFAMLLVLGAAALLQATYSASQAREKLLRQIPRLERELAAIHAMGSTWNELKTRPLPPPGLQGEALRDWAQSTAKSLGNSLSIQASGAGQLSLKGTVPVDAWLDWLATAQHTQHLYPQHVTLSATGQSGWVNLSAELSRPETP